LDRNRYLYVALIPLWWFCIAPLCKTERNPSPNPPRWESSWKGSLLWWFHLLPLLPRDVYVTTKNRF
jgi:hypothetical protein